MISFNRKEKALVSVGKLRTRAESTEPLYKALCIFNNIILSLKKKYKNEEAHHEIIINRTRNDYSL